MKDFSSHFNKKQFSELSGIDEDRMPEILEIGEFRVFKKNELILDNSTICNEMGFLVNGAVRTFCMNGNGEEISFLLQVNGNFIGDYESFITGNKATFFIETLIETEVFFIKKSDWEELVERDIYWLKFSKRASDISFLEAKRRIEELLFYTPEQRYLNLLEQSKEIIKKIPQKYISSYLGITPQSLSRIRKRIF